MKSIKSCMDNILKYLTNICFAGMIAVVLLQIFSRFALPKAPSWTEEASRYFFIYLVTFSAGLAVKQKSFVNVDTVLNLLPKKIATVLSQIIVNMVVVLFMGTFTIKSIKFIKLGSMQKSDALLIPMHYIYVSTFIFGIFIIIYTIIDIVDGFNVLRKGAK